MKPDCELLQYFARTNSEDAFAELVKRYVNLVYSAALRQVEGDEHLAKDVAQSVFTDLARKAKALVHHQNLTGWLYTSAHYAAAKIIRTETRRRDREHQFMGEPTNQSGAGVSPAAALENEWQQLSAALDTAMHELKAADRDVILFRYFENRPFAEVGARVGLTENAARMRVERALEKLRTSFAKRGIATTSALAAAISANAVQLAPVSLTSALTTTAIATAGTGAFTLMNFLTMTKLKIGLAMLVVAGGAIAILLQQQGQEKLLARNAALQQQVAQLKTDNQVLSNRLVEVADVKKLSETQFNELLKLRGDVGLLRNQASDLSQHNVVLKRQLDDVSKTGTNRVSVLQVHVKARFVAIPKDGFATQITGGNGATGILSLQNFTNLFAVLERHAGVAFLAEPEVTTTGGRQTQMRATQVITLVTNFALVESNGASAVVPQSCQVETGPIVDVVPQILPDDHTIALSLTASMTDFLGYEQPTNGPVPAYTKDGQEVDVPQVLPQFRVQEASTKVNMWDNQTLVLKLPDKQLPSDAFLQKQVPSNGLIQSSSDPQIKDGLKETLVFVTATIIDRAGNREYHEENNAIPDQPDPSSN